MVRAGIISYSNVLLEKYAKYALDSLETNKQKKSFQKSSRAIKKKKKIDNQNSVNLPWENRSFRTLQSLEHLWNLVEREEDTNE